VPFTQGERRTGASFKGVSQRPNKKKGKKKVATRTAARSNRRRTTANRRRTTANRRSSGVRPNGPRAKRARRAAAAKKTSKKKATSKKRTTKRTTKKKVAKKRAKRRDVGGFGGIARAAGAQKEAQRRKKRISAFPAQYKKIQKKRTVKMRTHFGPYRRAKLVNPESGKSEYSYLYRTKSGAFRKIPKWAIAGAASAKDMNQVLKGRAGTKSDQDAMRERLGMVRARRQKAASRITKKGGAFTPNTPAQRRSGRRTNKFLQMKRDGMKVRDAAKEAVRLVPFTKTEEEKGKAFKGVNNRDAGVSKVAGKRRTRKKTSSRRRSTGRRRTTKRRTTRKKRPSRRRTTKKRSTRRRTTKKRPTRRRKSTRRRTSARRRTSKRRSTRRRARPNRRRAYAANKRRRPNRRRARPNRRRYRRNQGFMADLQKLLKTGSLILGGFVAHRVITGFACQVVPAAGLGTWHKPVCGGATMALGIMGVNTLMKKAKPETRAAINGGMAVSFLQQVAVGIATAMGQTGLLTYLEGYPHSSAYRLRGVGRSGMWGGRAQSGLRGMGALERHAVSTMPQYAPVSGMGQYRQAAAGVRGTGEYFASNAMGEYFANKGLQGVGNYEKAGPLALQPNRAMGQEIDDGIRPDANLDQIMTLAESAAGLGQGFHQAAAGMGQFRQAAAGMRGMRGMGEFYSAAPGNGSSVEYRVPTQSQWIPQGPLWAGTMSAADTPTESEIPAGILQGPGGNGILSGG
jgi:serine/arginine repetitive matrix protein 2